MSIAAQRGTSLGKPGKFEFGKVTLEMVPGIWKEFVDMVEAYDGGWLESVDPVEVFTAVMHGQIELWAAFDDMRLVGGMAAAWERHAKASYYHIIWLGGQPGRIDSFLSNGLEKIEKYALAMGARDVVALGRKGWERKLKAFGYVSRYVQVRKNVREAWSN